MTGAMWDILIAMVTNDLENFKPKENRAADGEYNGGPDASGEPIAGPASAGMYVTPAQALIFAANRFRRIALQPLDLCPPCDIQFIDYARAVIRNDILTNPVDKLGYRQIMLDVFHRRGLCSCAYIPGRALPANCLFQEAFQIERLDFVFLDIDRLSRSRTAARYFLNDNLDLLHIPPDKNFRVVDLYDINKLDALIQRCFPARSPWLTPGRKRLSCKMTRRRPGLR